MVSRWQSSRRGSLDQSDQSVPFGRQLDRARQGDPEAISRLYRQFLPVVFSYIAARVPDRFIAEDLTSEVFLSMFEGISRLRATEETGFVAWMLQITRITVASYYRKREHQPSMLSLSNPAVDEAHEKKEFLALASPYPSDDPVYQAEVREEWGEVVAAINTLTEEQRQVVVCRLILGYDVETVGRMLGKKANAIKALQFRATQSLRRLLHLQVVPRQIPPSQDRDQEGAS